MKTGINHRLLGRPVRLLRRDGTVYLEVKRWWGWRPVRELRANYGGAYYATVTFHTFEQGLNFVKAHREREACQTTMIEYEETL